MGTDVMNIQLEKENVIKYGREGKGYKMGDMEKGWGKKRMTPINENPFWREWRGGDISK